MRRGLFIFLVLLASSALPSGLCHKTLLAGAYELSVAKKSPVVLTVDFKKLDAWVEAHPPQTRPFAEMVRAHLKLVPFQDLERSLAEMARKYLAGLKKSDKPALVYSLGETFEENLGNSSFKSSMWFIGWLQSKFPEFAQMPVILLEDTASLNAALQMGMNRFIYPDDHSITATQVKFSISRLERVRTRKTYQFDLLIAYATESAMSKTDGKEHFKVNWVEGTQTIPMFSDIPNFFETIGVWSNQQNWSSDQGTDYEMLEQGSTLVFEHSDLDFQSFPEFIKKGEVKDAQFKTISRIQFINQSPPVYRMFQPRLREVND